MIRTVVHYVDSDISLAASRNFPAILSTLATACRRTLSRPMISLFQLSGKSFGD
jgi:hypothetical protein